jgi:hypothetical protein
MNAAEEKLRKLAAATFSELTDAERELLRAAPHGEFALCGGRTEEENDLKHADNWGQQRTIHASFIRWLCVDRDASSHINPKGIRIAYAKIKGTLDFESVTIPFPLIMVRCFIREGMNLMFAKTRLLSFEGSRSGCITGDRLVVRGDILLRKRFVAEGTVRLNSANITGVLDCSDGAFLNPGGIALNASGATIGGYALLHDGFMAEGAVRLNAANITGVLDCSDGAFLNPGGIALNAEGITVGGLAALRHGFLAEGLVRLSGGKIGTRLDFSEAQFIGTPHNGLLAKNVTVSGLLSWRKVATTSDTILDLWGARIGQLADDKESWPEPEKLDLDDFVYSSITDGPMDAKTRLCWLERQAPLPLDPPLEQQASSSNRSKPFRSKPYQQLAKVFRESGHEADAKKILIASEQARRKHGQLGWGASAWSLAKWAIIGYGYESHRALYWAVFFIMLGWLLFAAGYRAGLVIPVKDDAYKIYATIGQVALAYPVFSPGIYALDTFLPIVTFGQKDAWGPDTTCQAHEMTYGPLPPLRPLGIDRLDAAITRGADALGAMMTAHCYLHWYRWFLIATGWLLTTLAVAGFTGLVRKE